MLHNSARHSGILSLPPAMGHVVLAGSSAHHEQPEGRVLQTGKGAQLEYICKKDGAGVRAAEEYFKEQHQAGHAPCAKTASKLALATHI